MPNTEDFKYPNNWTVHEDVQVILQTPKVDFQLKEWKRLPRKTKKHLKKTLKTPFWRKRYNNLVPTLPFLVYFKGVTECYKWLDSICGTFKK